VFISLISVPLLPVRRSSFSSTVNRIKPFLHPKPLVQPYRQCLPPKILAIPETLYTSLALWPSSDHAQSLNTDRPAHVNEADEPFLTLLSQITAAQ
jgi:hypothetical protein